MVKTQQQRHNLSPVKSGTRITESMLVADIVALCPEAQSVLAEYGLHCTGCAANAFEMLGDGCRGHGFEEEEIRELVDDLNVLLKRLPERPQILTISTSAARAIRSIAEAEERLGEALAVTVDGHGGFCMEFEKKFPADAAVFGNADVPDVRIIASSLTLQRIGGATIDFREGRFKLDLEDAACRCDSEGCSCEN